MCCTEVLPVHHSVLKRFSKQILLKAGLLPSSNLFWKISDKFGQEFYGPAFTSTAGTTLINVQLLDSYSFNEHAGEFVLQIVDGQKEPVELQLRLGKCTEVVIQFANIRDLAGNPHNVIS